MGRVRKASTRSSISSHSRDTWLFEMPVPPIA